MSKLAPLPELDLLSDVPVSDVEMIGLLRTLQCALQPAQRAAIGIVSTMPGEGVSTIARGLARIASQAANLKVLICDVFSEPAAISNRPYNLPCPIVGSAASSIELSKAVAWLPQSRVAVGTLADPGWINGMATDTERLRFVMESLKATFDLVILDLPPVGRNVPTLSISKAVDGLVLVVEAESTRVPAIRAARQTIEASGGRILGAVLNKRRLHIPQSVYGRI
jgi:Mrp family chromosome partitioning ATPase